MKITGKLESDAASIVSLYDNLTLARNSAIRRLESLREHREVLVRTLAAVDSQIASLPTAIAKYTADLDQLHIDYRVILIQRRIDDLEANHKREMKQLGKLLNSVKTQPR